MTRPTGGPFGEWLRGWRKANRYTMDGLSALSGIAKAQIFALERSAEINPRLTTMMALSKATKTPIEQVARIAAMQALAQRGEGPAKGSPQG